MSDIELPRSRTVQFSLSQKIPTPHLLPSPSQDFPEWDPFWNLSPRQGALSALRGSHKTPLLPRASFLSGSFRDNHAPMTDILSREFRSCPLLQPSAPRSCPDSDGTVRRLLCGLRFAGDPIVAATGLLSFRQVSP